MTTKNAKAKYIATRGVSWRVGEREVNRESGDDISDAPADVLKELLAWPPEAPAAVPGVPKPVEEPTDGEA